jgi:hypothetical protein
VESPQKAMHGGRWGTFRKAGQRQEKSPILHAHAREKEISRFRSIVSADFWPQCCLSFDIVSILVIRSWQEIDPDGPPFFEHRVRHPPINVLFELRHRGHAVT